MRLRWEVGCCFELRTGGGMGDACACRCGYEASGLPCSAWSIGSQGTRVPSAQSAAAHRLHPEESEVAELVHRRVAAEAGGAEAEVAAEAVIKVRAMSCSWLAVEAAVPHPCCRTVVCLPLA